MPTLGKKFLAEWKKCERCPLHQRRNQVVFYRGSIPCNLLFIGEAPGKSENALGRPFIGPSGKLLDEMLGESLADIDASITFGVTNVVGCIPWNDKKVGVRPPTPEEAAACRPRLLHTISKVQAEAVVLLGKSAEQYVSFLPEDLPLLKLQHPAYVIRHGRGPSEPRSRFVVYLREFIQTHFA